jgi:hypothetical protein
VAGRPPHQPTALYAPREDTTREFTATPRQWSNSRTGHLHGPNTPTTPSSHLTTASYASLGTSEVIALTANAPTGRTSTPTNALSAAARTTTHSPGTAANLLPIDKFLFACPPKLSYVDFSSSVIHCLPYPSSSHEHSLIFDRVLHPYSPDAFESLLRKHNLLDSYPLLPNNLRFGFPLGFMPPILQTVIIPNNPSILPHMIFIQEYLSKELVAGRMSGPFAREETELILCGPFQSSPLIVSAQPQEPGIPDKLRICRHLSKATKSHASVNSHIRKDDFPTRFDMALAVAGIVSPHLSISSPIHLHLPFM